MTRGMTLVEVFIAMAISGLLLAALVNLFGTFNVLYDYQKASRDTAGAGSAVLHAVEDAVAPSDHIVTMHDFSGTSYSSSVSSLVLEMPSVDASGVTLSGQYDYVAFYRNGTSVYRVTGATSGSARRSGTNKLGDVIVSLAFSYDDPDVTRAKVVTIDVVASTTVRAVQTTNHLSETLRLRNF